MGDAGSRISAVVLAGGQSLRMGQDKRFLELDGETLLVRVLRVLEAIFSEILLVVATETPELNEFGHPVVTDLIPGCASLGGIYTGLAAATHPQVFVAACDMPLLNAEVVRYIAAQPEADIVMAELTVGLQPTHARYSKACLPHLENMARGGHLTLQDLLQREGLTTRILPETELRRLDPDLLSFLNVNTPADLEFARKLLANRGSQPMRKR
jgi:molybdopterin-guanine dinucleotide biosynthesis protein A